MTVIPAHSPPMACLAAAAEGQWVLGPGFGDGQWVTLAAPVATFRADEGNAATGAALRQFARDIPPGGAVAGYIGYEFATAMEPSLALPPAPDGLPLVWAARFTDPVRYPVGQGDEMPIPPLPGDPRIADQTSRPAYEDKVRAVISSIRAGDIFQANISRRLSAFLPDADGLTAALFGRLTAGGAAAYAGCLSLPGGAVLSNSPELFLRMDGRHVMAEPIKGTRPRGLTPQEDELLARALMRDEKDRAENVMIADLLRNDLAKVCEDHSITEDAICALRTLPHIHHLYSVISGRLRKGVSPMEAALAAFPCGSITGAPKHRAMQVIAREEGEGRGPYCGTVFYIPDKGPAVFSVAIRTGVLSLDGEQVRLDVRAGGGITILSDPLAEYEETADKAYPFRKMIS